MATVYQTDNRSGITYAYESVSKWDKEKKQSRSARTLIGRVDEETGLIVPTDGRMKREKGTNAPHKAAQKSLGLKRLFYGATYLLDAIGEKLGLKEDLRQCFPDTHEEMLSLAYYLIMEDRNPLCRFEKWSQQHKHPCGDGIPTQRSDEIFSSINEDNMHQFFQLQSQRLAEDEYWAYDITTISNDDECLRQMQHWQNKGSDGLPLLKFALVFGERSRLPLYFRKLAGDIPDLMAAWELLPELDGFGFKKVKLVMDSGFYKEENINGLLKDRLKFIVPVKMSLRFVRAELDKVYDKLLTLEHYNEDHELYLMNVPYEWPYSQARPHRGEAQKETRRFYIHFYYNTDKAEADKEDFGLMLMSLKNEIISGNQAPEHEKLYKKYFAVKSSPGRGSRATVNEDAVNEAKRYFGFSALLTNEKMDSLAALGLYGNKDLAEKAYRNLKERLNSRRVPAYPEQSLDGKMFVEFIALIYLSYLNKQMQDARLCRSHSLAGLLDKLDVIECFEHPELRLQVGEVLDKQRELYTALGVDPPSSLYQTKK